jgi:hypothetical protein
MMDFICDLYDQIWWHCQFWVDDYIRRPFTLIMRDGVNRYPYIGIPLILALGAGIGYLIHLSIYWYFLGAFYWLLVGHVCWAKWTPDEQEYPTYIED